MLLSCAEGKEVKKVKGSGRSLHQRELLPSNKQARKRVAADISRLRLLCGFVFLPPFSTLFPPFHLLTLDRREKRAEGKGATLSLDYFLTVRDIKFLGAKFDLHRQNISFLVVSSLHMTTLLGP